MRTLQSADGTTIAHQATGEGPALVLVVGAACDSSTTAGLTALLRSSHTVHEYDRRGRGASTDTPPYDVQREVEDLAAVLAATGEVPFVAGHSSGGQIALEAAAQGVPMRKLLAYEPPYVAEEDGSGGSEDLLAELRRRVAAGDRDGAVAAFFEGVGMPPEAIAGFRGSPGWHHVRDMAPTLVYDTTLGNGGVVPRERLARVGVPTLVAAGGDSPPWAARAAAAVAAAVPGAAWRVVPGQGHGLADEAFAPLLREWFAPVPSPSTPEEVPA
jgi:pimeloyl-ACP methyl ester carboxylesterase